MFTDEYLTEAAEVLRQLDRAAIERMVTPHTESFQAVIWHLLVSHPSLKRAATKW